MLFVWVISKFFDDCDCWITPYLKWSLLCIVDCAWSFWVKDLICPYIILYLIGSRILSSNISLPAKLSGKPQMIRTNNGSSGQNFLRKSGWSGPTPDHPTFSAKTLLSKPGWSDHSSDHPNLEISRWSRRTLDHPDPAPKNLSGHDRMIRPYPGSSGPDSWPILGPAAGVP